MYCPKCGVDLSDDSQFCRKCGQSQAVVSPTGAAVAVAPARVAVDKPRSKWSFGVFVVLLALIVLWVATSHSPVARQLQQIAKQQHTQQIDNPAEVVNAVSYTYSRFDAPSGATNVSLQGDFTASGGLGNDIQAYVLSEADFVNWQNRHASSSYYNSGKVTVGKITASLPAGAGTYYLVFDNRFSLLSRKSVRVKATFAYEQ
jgi:hypothetical protein